MINKLINSTIWRTDCKSALAGNIYILLVFMIFFNGEKLKFTNPENFDLFGVYEFEVKVKEDSVSYFLRLRICKNYEYTIDTSSRVNISKYKKNIWDGDLSNDMVTIYPSENYGRYNQNRDTLIFVRTKTSQVQMKIMFIDSINLVMIDCPFDSSFNNLVGHKTDAFYSNHFCRQKLSTEGWKWSYFEVLNPATKRYENAWHFYDTSTVYPIDYKSIIFEDKQNKKYLDREWYKKSIGLDSDGN